MLLSSRSPFTPAQVLFLLTLISSSTPNPTNFSDTHFSVSVTLNPEYLSSSHNRIIMAAEFILHTVAKITFIVPLLSSKMLYRLCHKYKTSHSWSHNVIFPQTNNTLHSSLLLTLSLLCSLTNNAHFLLKNITQSSLT